MIQVLSILESLYFWVALLLVYFFTVMLNLVFHKQEVRVPFVVSKIIYLFLGIIILFLIFGISYRLTILLGLIFFSIIVANLKKLNCNIKLIIIIVLAVSSVAYIFYPKQYIFVSSAVYHPIVKCQCIGIPISTIGGNCETKCIGKGILINIVRSD